MPVGNTSVWPPGLKLSRYRWIAYSERGENMESGWEFNHIGAVVRDVDKAVEHYQSLGIVDKVTDRVTMEGKKAKLIGRFINIGPLRIELWQPVRGETVQQEFLDGGGEGVNHIAFHVADLDEEKEKMAEKGIPVVFSVRDEEGYMAYFDTRKVGNILIELIQPPE
jgi:4-hydroxyphenylpyruvate dioxygenase-like putative hemolysin